jgi:CheY-like chemotaxis protein
MSSPQPAKKRVLVVEDDRTLRHALVTLLEAAGFAANGVGDGSAALAELREKQFDVIILDLGLPRISGLEVLAEIQNFDAPPKVIVVTADETPAAGFRPSATRLPVHRSRRRRALLHWSRGYSRSVRSVNRSGVRACGVAGAGGAAGKRRNAFKRSSRN